MGWTTTSDCERTSKGLFTIREYLDREFACDDPDFPKFEILDSALVGRSEYYAAIRRTDRATGAATVFTLIALVSYKPRDPDGHTLGYKEMDECVGPHVCRCPERILARLDPPCNENAADWRRRCRERRAREAWVRRAIRPGAVVVLAEALRFRGGGEYRRFTVEKHGRRTLYRAPDGALCRIPKIAERDFHLVAHPTDDIGAPA